MDSMQSLEFTSFDQVKSGLTWTSERITKIAEYERLDSNRDRHTPKEFETAIKKGAQWVQFNWYARVAAFWVDSLWGRPPTGLRDGLVDVFARASRHRSVGGHGVLAIERDHTIRVIPPAQWHPVHDPADRDHWIGHLLAWFYVSDAKPDDASRAPDRVDVLQIGPNVNRRQTWSLEGVTLDEMLDERESDLSAVVVWGDGISDFRDLRPVLDEAEYRFNRMKRTADWHSDPALSGPVLGQDQRHQEQRAVSEKNMTGSQIHTDRAMNAVAGGGTPFLARRRDDPEWSYLSFDGKLGDSQWMLNWLQDQFHAATGIPSSALGLTDHHHQSGVSRTRMMSSALQRLRSLRREVTPAIRELGRLTDQPVDELRWPDAPFADFVDLSRIVGELVRRGVQSPEQGAALLGLDAPPPSMSRPAGQ